MKDPKNYHIEEDFLRDLDRETFYLSCGICYRNFRVSINECEDSRLDFISIYCDKCHVHTICKSVFLGRKIYSDEIQIFLQKCLLNLKDKSSSLYNERNLDCFSPILDLNSLFHLKKLKLYKDENDFCMNFYFNDYSHILKGKNIFKLRRVLSSRENMVHLLNQIIENMKNNVIFEDDYSYPYENSNILNSYSEQYLNPLIGRRQNIQRNLGLRSFFQFQDKDRAKIFSEFLRR